MRFNRIYNDHKTNNDQPKFRLSMIGTLLIILSFVLIQRLAYLQFSQYKLYATLSLKNQMSILPIAPPRGIIVDRNGVILADNIPVYALELTPELIKNLPETLHQIRELLPSISEEEMNRFNRERKNSHRYDSIPLKMHLSEDEVATFASNQYRFTGVHIKARLMRYYPLSEQTAHVVGNIGRINMKELEQIKSTNYRATNFMGKTGIEKYYENQLHGKVGFQQVETDASGRIVRTISKQAPISGAKLYLTIDSRLQKEAYEALQDKRGSIVVINAKNGEVLTMASAPAFDPNLFVNGISNNDYQKLSNSPDRPLYNRAVRGQYPPASTIKPYMALAGLESGLITPETQIYDPGWYRLPTASHVYKDWKHSGHGIVNLKRAIAQSCDTYFYQLGNRIGISAIEEMLVQFGFGQLTRIDLLEEAPGIVPNPKWKIKNKQAHWYPGDTVITAIGQGFMLASPLQIAHAAAILSQNGNNFRPHLMGKLEFEKGNIKTYAPHEEYPVHLNDEKYWNMVKIGMAAVLHREEGTGWRFGFDAPYPVAGKTGTAQVFSGSKYAKTAYNNIPYALRDNSLFIAFSPIDNPEVAIAVVVEHDVAAATIARRILDAYYKFKNLEQNQHELSTAQTNVPFN